MPEAAPAVAEIPFYREGGSDAESSRRLDADRPGFIVRAYRSAGPIFRTVVDGRSWVILAGLEANDFVWRHSDLWNYPIMFPAFGEQMGPDHLNVLEGEAHRHKRTVLKPAFDVAPAMRYLPQFNASFHAGLAAVSGRGPIDLVEFWAEAITIANTQTVAQVELGLEKLQRLVRWERELLPGIQMGDARHAYYARPEYVALRAEAMEIMGAMVDERLAHPDRHDDNFQRVLAERRDQPGGYPPRGHLIDDLYYILVAGIENTSRLINWVALHCFLSPGWYDRVVAEVDAWDGQDVMALAGMPVLKAVIMETQRLRPPAFFVPRHAARDFEFAGFHVPAGTDLLSANAAGHFLDEVYPDAMSFRPERFLDGSRFVPRSNGFFGGGMHICLGRNHTQFQTPVAVAQLLKYHRIAYRDEAGLRRAVASAQDLPTEIWGGLEARCP